MIGCLGQGGLGKEWDSVEGSMVQVPRLRTYRTSKAHELCFGGASLVKVFGNMVC
jgi:hypothetical protein